jgi:hypothetical protein
MTFVYIFSLLFLNLEVINLLILHKKAPKNKPYKLKNIRVPTRSIQIRQLNTIKICSL